MNLSFHVSPVITESTEQKPMRARTMTLVDVDVEWVDEPAPRGVSIETWQRARGWASED